MSNTLVIEGVDFELLESQRHALKKELYENEAQLEDDMEPDALEALKGILNMLERWSDIRYHEANGDLNFADIVREGRC